MPQAECENLLLCSLDCQFMAIPYSNVFFHLLILFARNMDRGVGMITVFRTAWSVVYLKEIRLCRRF